MNKKSSDDEVETLLKQLLAIELWRGGLTQSQITKRLKLSSNTVNEMLKGVSREIAVSVVAKE